MELARLIEDAILRFYERPQDEPHTASNIANKVYDEHYLFCGAQYLFHSSDTDVAFFRKAVYTTLARLHKQGRIPAYVDDIAEFEQRRGVQSARVPVYVDQVRYNLRPTRIAYYHSKMRVR